MIDPVVRAQPDSLGQGFQNVSEYRIEALGLPELDAGRLQADQGRVRLLEQPDLLPHPSAPRTPLPSGAPSAPRGPSAPTDLTPFAGSHPDPPALHPSAVSRGPVGSFRTSGPQSRPRNPHRNRPRNGQRQRPLPAPLMRMQTSAPEEPDALPPPPFAPPPPAFPPSGPPLPWSGPPQLPRRPVGQRRRAHPERRRDGLRALLGGPAAPDRLPSLSWRKVRRDSSGCNRGPRSMTQRGVARGSVSTSAVAAAVSLPLPPLPLPVAAALALSYLPLHLQ